MEDRNEMAHKVKRNDDETSRPRTESTDWFGRIWGGPARARIVIIGLAVLLPIVGAIPVLIFAPVAVFAEYVKWSSPVVTTGLGYLFGHGQRV